MAPPGNQAANREHKLRPTAWGVPDLLENSAGMLVMMYDAPKGKNAERILSRFDGPPWILEFERKFSNSSSAITRYERNLDGFGRFLQQSGLLRKGNHALADCMTINHRS